MDLAWRALAKDDAEAVSALVAAAEKVDDAGESYSPEDVVDTLSGAAIDAELGSLGAFGSEGTLAAFGLVFARTSADPVHEMHCWGLVRPELRRRGIGAELTERMIAAAREISEALFPGAPMSLTASVLDKDLARAALLASAGFSADRYDFGMLRSLDDGDRTTEPAVPAGYLLVPFSPEVSEEMRAVHNEGFVPDHPGSTVATPQVWAERVGISSSRPDLSFGVRHEASGQLAGYVLVQYYEADTEATGLRDAYIHYLGTRREHRRKGVAAALLGAVLHAAAREGMDTASLEVQAENPSGALGVYRRAGFEVQRTFAVHRWTAA